MDWAEPKKAQAQWTEQIDGGRLGRRETRRRWQMGLDPLWASLSQREVVSGQETEAGDRTVDAARVGMLNQGVGSKEDPACLGTPRSVASLPRMSSGDADGRAQNGRRPLEDSYMPQAE